MTLTLNLKIASKSKTNTEVLFQQIKEAVEQKIENNYPEVDEILLKAEFV